MDEQCNVYDGQKHRNILLYFIIILLVDGVRNTILDSILIGELLAGQFMIDSTLGATEQAEVLNRFLGGPRKNFKIFAAEINVNVSFKTRNGKHRVLYNNTFSFFIFNYHFFSALPHPRALIEHEA